MQEFAHNPHFQRLVDGATDVDLVELMLEMAHDAYGELDLATCRSEVERLAERARRRVGRLLPGAAGVRDGLAKVAVLLCQDEGFRGNREDYDDPRNSYLNEVLQRRLGIPIALGVLFIAVARRANLPVYGVPTPGHFVVGCQAGSEAVYLDPFSGSEILSREDCRRRVEAMTGMRDWPEDLFRPASVAEIAVRFLRNLKAAYARREQWAQALPVQARLAALLPECSDEQRDLGLVLLRNGQAWPALSLLERYVEKRPDEAAVMRPFLRTARRLGAEMN
ncbi:MAG: tetratricopeptide repeat protein [Planctomycetia bacterium]|nr:tetratricopeptide repeat protein [Planctomycetia bacterium]